MCCIPEDKYLAISCDLIEEVLLKKQALSFNISTKSMWPLLAPGDSAMVESTSPHELKFGDPVLFKKGDGSIYLHRFLYRTKKDGKRFLVTKGDNEISFDGYVNENDVMGKVVGCHKNSAFLNFDALFWKLLNRAIACLSLFEGIIFSTLRWIKRRVCYIISYR